MDGNTRLVVVTYDSNEQRIGRCLPILTQGLRPFVEKFLKTAYGERWVIVAHEGKNVEDDRNIKVLALKIPLSIIPSNIEKLDTRYIIQLIIKFWNEGVHAFSSLEPFHKNLAFELRQVRNEWAHQVKFSIEDTYRALDNMTRLLTAVGAVKEAAIVAEERKDVAIEMAQQILKEREFQKLNPHIQIHSPSTNSNISNPKKAEYSEDMMED